MIRTRAATPGDIPWLVTQLRAFDQFFGGKHSLVPADPETTVQQLIERCFFNVAETDDGLVGFIAGAITPHIFNPQIRVLNELLWWVDPAARGSWAGAQLLLDFEAYGLANADWIVMTLETNSPLHPGSLEKRGFRLTERNYLLEV